MTATKIGVPLFMLRPEHMARIALRAETLGFESVWVAEHLVFPTQIQQPIPVQRRGRSADQPGDAAARSPAGVDAGRGA